MRRVEEKVRLWVTCNPETVAREGWTRGCTFLYLLKIFTSKPYKCKVDFKDSYGD
jgi:hypothetical protein